MLVLQMSVQGWIAQISFRTEATFMIAALSLFILLFCTFVISIMIIHFIILVTLLTIIIDKVSLLKNILVSESSYFCRIVRILRWLGSVLRISRWLRLSLLTRFIFRHL